MSTEKYISFWWELDGDDEFPRIENQLNYYLKQGFELCQMFLVYSRKDEAYRVIMRKPINK